MLNDLAASFARVWSDLTGGLHAPLAFRVIVQPLVAAFFAVRAGRRDALEGRPLFFWAVLGDPLRRRERLCEAWQHVGKVFLAAVVIDVVYQLVVRQGIDPFEAIVVGAILAVLPYLVFRGIVNRLLRKRVRVAE
jgi:hypothetical protein